MIHATRGILEAKDTNVLYVLIMIFAHHVMKTVQEVQGIHWIIQYNAFLLEVILVSFCDLQPSFLQYLCFFPNHFQHSSI